MASGRTSDYEEFIKQQSVEQAGVKNWEDMFAKMTLSGWSSASKSYAQQERDTIGAYASANVALSQQAQKDISSAYSNYLTSQLAINSARGLTAGYKDRLSKDIDEAYKNSVYETNQALKDEKAALLSQEKQDLTTLEQNKQTTLSEVASNVSEIKSAYEKNITEQANRMLGYERDVLKAAYEKYGAESPDLFKVNDKGKLLGWSDAAKSRIFKTSQDAEGNTWQEFTDEGKNLYSDVLQNAFNDWAYVNYKAEDYQKYMENDIGIFNTALFDSPLNPYGSAKEDGTLWGKDAVSSTAEGVRVDSLKSVNGVSNVKNVGELTKQNKKDIFVKTDLKPTTSYSNPKSDVTIKRVDMINGITTAESQKFKAAIESLKQNEKIKAGDVINLDNKVLAYYDGKDFRYVEYSQDVLNKLKLGNI